MPNPETPTDMEYLELVDEPVFPVTEAAGSGDEQPVKVDPPKEEPVEEPLDPKDDPKRIQYWQSRADKYQRQLEESRPILDVIAKSATVRDAIAKAVEGEVAPVPTKPEKPVPPAKPSNYDEVSAFQDPDSPSFKYRAALEKYYEEREQYRDKMEELRQAEFDRIRTETERRQKASEAEIRTRKALTERGIVGEEQQKFFEVMNSPETFKIDNLVTYYQALVHGTNQVTKEEIAAKQKEFEDRIRRGQAPLPAGVTPSLNTPRAEEMSESDNFNESLLSAGRELQKKKIRVLPR